MPKYETVADTLNWRPSLIQANEQMHYFPIIHKWSSVLFQGSSLCTLCNWHISQLHYVLSTISVHGFWVRVILLDNK